MNLLRQRAVHKAEKQGERQQSERKKAEGKRQMVRNDRENDAHSYHRCLSIFKTLNVYIFEKFRHSDKTLFSFPFIFIPFTPPLPMCIFFLIFIDNIWYMTNIMKVDRVWCQDYKTTQVYRMSPGSVLCRWLKHRSVNEKVADSNSSQGMCLGCRFCPRSGHVQEAANRYFSLSFHPFPSL